MRYSPLSVINKLFLVILTVLAVAALSSASGEENSLSETPASSRVARRQGGRRTRQGPMKKQNKKMSNVRMYNKTSREMKEALKRAAGMAQRKWEEVECRVTN